MTRSQGASTSGTNEDPLGRDGTPLVSKTDDTVKWTPTTSRAELERQLGFDLEVAGEVAWRSAILLTRQRDLAQDLVQETFVRLAQAVRAETLNVHSNGRAYLRQAVVNTFRDNLRKRKRLTHSEVLLDDFEWLQGSRNDLNQARPEEIVETLELNAQITTAIRSLDLSEDNRRILVLLVMGGYSINQVSAFLGIPPSTVRSRIRAIRKDIRSILRRTGWEVN